jgi:hypothetical protein
MDTSRQLGLALAFTYSTRVSEPHDVGAGPCGLRQYYEMTDGLLVGPSLSGRTLGSGADWMLQGADGYLRMDARIQIQTEDQAVICARYFGVAEANSRFLEALAASEATGFEDQRIRTHWVLETGHPHYLWVNQAVFVGEGRSRPVGKGLAGFELRVYTID